MRTPADILTYHTCKISRLVCGIMSGTSADAIDVALVRIHGSGTATRLSDLHFTEVPFSDEVRSMILQNAEAATSTVEGLCVLHSVLAHLYEDAVRTACEQADTAIADIDLIGLHGQTVHHMPEPVLIDGRAVRSTLQIGSAPVLAARLGVPVVSDFRSADMALGGQGAPLVPYVDYILFHSQTTNRVLLNIGGIANLTWLPAGCGEDAVVAFDTGPGNMVVDALMELLLQQPFDAGGTTAQAGRVKLDLLSWCMAHPYISKAIPKSTGREAFGTRYIEEFLAIARDLDISAPQNLVATAAEFTVQSIVHSLKAVMPEGETYELIVSGGGAKNRYFTDGLRMELPEACFVAPGDFGIEADAKEAVCFAVLANEWLSGNASNMPSVTGASRKILLGIFALG